MPDEFLLALLLVKLLPDILILALPMFSKLSCY